MTTSTAAFEAAAFVKTWIAEHVAHGGAVDAVSVANGSADADDFTNQALNFNPTTANDQALQDFAAECDENCRFVRAEFVRFVDQCVEEAEALDA